MISVPDFIKRNSNKLDRVVKRDGQIVDFDQKKITSAIFKALQATEAGDEKLAQKLSDQIVDKIKKKFSERTIPAVEEIQDLVEEVLVENKLTKTVRAYVLYRTQHALIRDYQNFIDSDKIMEGYLHRQDWRVKENSNMSYSLQGLNNHVASKISNHYWLNKIYPPEIRQAHLDGDFHIHDLYAMAPYCTGWDLKDLLIRGFSGVSGKVQSKPAKHFRTALGQVVNFFYTIQGEIAGAVAFSSFDTLLAPFIRYDDLTYDMVKQAMQEFIFNMNVPTRVGFQCMSDDTDILSQNGWKKHNQVKEGDIIATFNVEKEFIEYLPVKHVFAKKYKGIMYNLKNRISDQLISPEHRVVRKRFGAAGYVLEKIEKILAIKSPFMVPVGSQGNIKGESNTEDDIVKLIAWIVAEGILDRNGRGDGRISIYQSKETSQENYEEIVSLCRSLKLKYAEREQSGLGKKCQVIRFDADSTRKIFQYFKTSKKDGIKFIPEIIINGDVETSRLFIETYIKGDGHDGCKITTTSKVIRDGLLQVMVNAGYGATVLVRKPDNQFSKKDRYIIRIIKHQDTYINTVKKVNYNGVIWCPNTDNETVIAKRNGKVFITGNTPFTNITLDVTVPRTFQEESVIIGGQPQKETYKEFQPEIDMFNRAFAEVMTAGDASGRVFTFPIPTYNLTKDMDWDSGVMGLVWEMTAKYGIPYFSNFVNSDMKPEDARSMCCRLRLDNRELRKRGGGLFGANPLTGSLGVVTLNMARLGYLAKDKDDLFQNLAKLMDLAKQSLEIKREVVEKFTDEGLYPYSRFYLSDIKEHFGEYWRNHFNTVGLNGLNEGMVNFLGKNLGNTEANELAQEILEFMRNRLMDYQLETNNLFNLEATPAEGATYRLAQVDKKKYPDIIVANEQAVRTKEAEPYYTNSSNLPVGLTDDIFSALDLQDNLQTKYTGGTVLHLFIGERLTNGEVVKKLAKKIAYNYHLPYFSVTPTFSVCPEHGYIAGEYFHCPECAQETEVYSRVVGYLRPVQQWNDGKRAEFAERKMFQIKSEQLEGEYKPINPSVELGDKKIKDKAGQSIVKEGN